MGHYAIPQRVQASSATWNCANSKGGMGLIEEYTVLKTAIFGCLERKLLVITDNSFAPSTGF